MKSKEITSTIIKTEN